MNFATRRLILSLVSVGSVMAAGLATAQDATSAAMARPQASGSCPCSNPVNINIVKNSGATTPFAADFAAGQLTANMTGYNSTLVNKLFAETIQWTLPTKTCELTGKLSYTVKNVANNGLQANDLTVLMHNGAQVPGTRHSIQLPVGQSQTFSYPLTPAQIQSGRVSIFVQDDTSVTDVRVSISGCCIRANLPN